MRINISLTEESNAKLTEISERVGKSKSRVIEELIQKMDEGTLEETLQRLIDEKADEMVSEIKGIIENASNGY